MEALIDLDMEIFQWYDDCGIDTLMVSIGIKTKNWSGFISSSINSFFSLFNLLLDANYQQQIIT